MSLNVETYPLFTGSHYKKWYDSIVPLLGIVDLLDILNGTLTAPTAVVEPVLPAMVPGANGGPATYPDAQAMGFYSAQVKQFERYEKMNEKYLKRRGEAKGVLSRALTPAIADQVKNMEPADAWTWLRTTYAAEQFVEILEDFKILTNFRIDLSDPKPQLAKFLFHYSRIPFTAEIQAGPNQDHIPATPYVSQSMATLILLLALPLSSDPAQDSVYQRMMEEYTSTHIVPIMTLDSLSESIRNTWASCFRHLKDNQKPSAIVANIMYQYPGIPQLT
jgi:hypothetical protein